MTPLASVCIPTRNRSRFLQRTLASYRQQRERRFELVLVDDGGDDDTRDIARAAGASGDLDVRYIRRAHSGIAASRNAAIRAARAAVLIFSDDDRVVDPGFIADHVAAHAAGETRTDGDDGAQRSGKPRSSRGWEGRTEVLASDGEAHPRVQGNEPDPACFRVVAGSQRGLFAAWATDAAYAPADVAALLARRPELRLGTEPRELVTPDMIAADLAGVLADFGLPEPWFEAVARPAIARHGAALAGFPFPWTLAVGGNMSVSRAALDAVGLHDEQFVGWGLEDTELHYRLFRAGARTQILDGGGLNYHQVHRRGPELAREWQVNAARLLAKHPTIDIALYLLVIRRAIDLPRAAVLLAEAAAAPALADEIVRLVRG